MRLPTARVLVAMAALAAYALPAEAVEVCPMPPAKAGEQRISEGPLQMSWRAEPERLTVGQPFALQMRLCPPEAKVVRVDATMPDHRHGMNYRPSVKALGEGHWRAEGLLWHMAGRWELAVEVEQGGERHWLRQSVTLR